MNITDDEMRAVREFVKRYDAACAVLRLPGHDNDGGPADLAEELKILLNNHQVALDGLREECERLRGQIKRTEEVDRFYREIRTEDPALERLRGEDWQEPLVAHVAMPEGYNARYIRVVVHTSTGDQLGEEEL